LTACATGIGVALGNSLYEKYLKDHVHKLPKIKREGDEKDV
jgi:hypothetical protein